jgi:hypothetical protein
MAVEMQRALGMPLYRGVERRARLRAARRGVSGDGVLGGREPVGCLAHEPFGLFAAQTPAADQVHGGRAHLGHDYADERFGVCSSTSVA